MSVSKSAFTDILGHIRQRSVESIPKNIAGFIDSNAIVSIINNIDLLVLSHGRGKGGIVGNKGNSAA